MMGSGAILLTVVQCQCFLNMKIFQKWLADCETLVNYSDCVHDLGSVSQRNFHLGSAG